jgi:hypothetical protein
MTCDTTDVGLLHGSRAGVPRRVKGSVASRHGGRRHLSRHRRPQHSARAHVQQHGAASGRAYHNGRCRRRKSQPSGGGRAAVVGQADLSSSAPARCGLLRPQRGARGCHQLAALPRTVLKRCRAATAPCARRMAVSQCCRFACASTRPVSTDGGFGACRCNRRRASGRAPAARPTHRWSRAWMRPKSCCSCARTATRRLPSANGEPRSSCAARCKSSSSELASDAAALLLQQHSCPPLRAALPFPPLCARCTCSKLVPAHD